MIELSSISMESSLINEELKEQLIGVLDKLKESITIKAIVDMEEEKSIEMASFLNVMASLSDKLQLELYTVSEGKDISELDQTYLPVTGLYKDGAYGRACFHGIPGGKELNSFVVAIYNLSGSGKPLGRGLLKKIDKLDKKINVKICVSLACHHCPGVVAACQQIAILNPNIEAEMIDAALYPELVAEYKIERIPMIIVNNQDIYMGNKTIEDIVILLKK